MKVLDTNVPFVLKLSPKKATRENLILFHSMVLFVATLASSTGSIKQEREK